MSIVVESPTFTAHGHGCPRCRASDFPSQLCRNGRRIFFRWLGEMTTDERAVFILGLPDDIRAEVAKNFTDDRFEFMTVVPPTNKEEN